MDGALGKFWCRVLMYVPCHPSMIGLAFTLYLAHTLSGECVWMLGHNPCLSNRCSRSIVSIG